MSWEIEGAAYTDEQVLGELVAGQGPVATCGCGWPVTEFDGRWLHVFNEDLTGTGDHDPDPDRDPDRDLDGEGG